MDIWLIEDGEKTGPFQSYEVHDRIDRGELNGEEMAWHESRSDWVALREMEMFGTIFLMREEEEGEASESGEAPDIPPPLPNRPRPFVRFWARWFDLHLYAIVVFGLIRLFGLDMVAAMASVWFVTLHLLPWVLMESIAIHLRGTTPGKWLLGVRVQRADGELLSLGASVMRGFRVLIFGMGLNLSIFMVICQGFSLWYTLRFRSSLWDRLPGNEVRVEGLPPGRIVTFVTLFLALVIVLSFIVEPASTEMMKRLREAFPELPLPVPDDAA